MVDHLKHNSGELSDDHLLSILEDRDSESDLSGDELVDIDTDTDSEDEDLLDSHNNLVENILGF